MSAGISAVAMVPLVASNAVFSTRRVSRGVDSMEETPVYGSMNIAIAGGQVFKGVKAAQTVAPIAETTATATNVLNSVAETSKTLKSLGTVFGVISNNINPLICVTSGIKVLGSDDKVDTAARESINLITMFAAEGAAKSIMGMPSIECSNGSLKQAIKEGLYTKSPVIKNWVDDFVKYCQKTKIGNYTLNFLPPTLKGLAFAGASIAGYKLGQRLSNCILGELPEEKK